MAEMQPPSQPAAPLPPHRGVLVLVLGVLGILLGFYKGVGVILAILAWVLGAIDLKAMKQGRMDPSGRGLTQAGWILGIVGVCLAIVVVIFIVLGMILLMTAAPHLMRSMPR